MMESSMIQLECQRCDTIYDMEAPYFIDATNDPDAKKSVTEGDVFYTWCPSCGEAAAVMFYLEYVDENTNLDVILAPTVQDREDALAVIAESQAEDPTMERRIVTTIEQLQEMIQIFDDDLDDNVVYAIKDFVQSEMDFDFDRNDQDPVLYLGRSDEGTYDFAIYETNGDTPVLTVSEEMFANFARCGNPYGDSD